MTTTTPETYEARRTREQAELAAEIARLASLADALTAETGEPWQYEAPDDPPCRVCMGFIRQRDGLELFLNANCGEKKTFHAGAARVKAPDGKRLELWKMRNRDTEPEAAANIGQSKTVAQIARDIARRILPNADIYAKRALDRYAADLDAGGQIEKTARALVEQWPGFGEFKPQGAPGDTQTLTGYNGTANQYAKAEIRAGAVSLKIDGLTPDQAARILRLVRRQQD